MAKRTKKRAFERVDGQLIDRFVGLDGKRVTSYAPSAMAGERVPAAQRARMLAQMKKGGRGAYALRHEESPEHFEALLGALAAGDSSAPSALTTYLDDPRVRPAILAAARAKPLGDASNHFQMLGYCGGAGAKEALTERLRALQGDPDTLKDDAFFNWKAGELGTVATALLRLDRDASQAAEALVSLLEHPCAFNRSSATRQMCEMLTDSSHGSIQTTAFRQMRKAIARMLKAPEDDAFLAALRALVITHRDEALARARRLLRSKKADTRRWTASALAALDAGRGGLPLLAEWVEEERELEVLTDTLRLFPFLIPLTRRRGLVRRSLADEAPSKRWYAVALLEHLPSADRRVAARTALKTEPDPAIAKALRKAAR